FLPFSFTQKRGKLVIEKQTLLMIILFSYFQKTLQHVYATKLPFFRNGDGAEKLFDVFEPGRIQAALERTELNLAHLIFPHSLCPIVGYNIPFTSCDPITELFGRRAFGLQIITYSWLLQKQQYGMLIQGNSGQFAWPALKFEQIIGEKRESMLFRNIVSKNTTDVAIGPLEYCGSGRMVKTTQGKKVLALCWNDTSSFSSPLLHREIAGLHRRNSGLDKPGTSKSAMSQRQKQRVFHALLTLLNHHLFQNVGGLARTNIL
ncbi:hypothetical protein GG344DRAFT_71105, partial [Lentinula edodes]